MLPLNLHVCLGLMVAFPLRTQQSCMQGKPKECLEAEFAPGSNLAGEGFDITKMERKGAFVIDMSAWSRPDKTCMLCSNPYLEGKRQKLPLSVVDWRSKNSCTQQISSALHRSSESLLSASTSSIDNNWKTSLDFSKGRRSASMILAGTHSKLAEYSLGKTKNDKFSFTSQSATCSYYSYRVSSSPQLNTEFLTAVEKLPKIYAPENKQRFYKLIDTFGTHYITKVTLGGTVRSVTSIRQCEASLQGLSGEEIQMCLEAEASATIRVDVKAETRHCKKDMEKNEYQKSFAGLFNDRFTEIRGGQTTEADLLFSANKDPSAYKAWLSTLPVNPDAVSYSLDSLHELLPTNTPARKNLRSAISHYILETGLWRNCSGPCQAGRKSDSRDACVCQCHNDPGVNQDCCPTRRGVAQVEITVDRASGLWGDHTTATDGYVKVFFQNVQVRRTRVLSNNNNPRWADVVDLGPQDLTAAPRVRFEVWDQDSGWDDDLLGSCEHILSAGAKEDVCALQHGRLYFRWKVECAPSLGGGRCQDYRSSPMSPSLRGLYTSRHAHPIPKAMLAEMGVFVSGGGATGNGSVY